MLKTQSYNKVTIAKTIIKWMTTNKRENGSSIHEDAFARGTILHIG